MVARLPDLQVRDVFTNPAHGERGVVELGGHVFEILQRPEAAGKLRGLFFRHYTRDPTALHVKLGARYEDPQELSHLAAAIDSLQLQYPGLVQSSDSFHSTDGDSHLPESVVADYVACLSFRYLLEASKEIGPRVPANHNMVVQFILGRRQRIEREVIGSPDIRRPGHERSLLHNEERRLVWKVFVHFFLNPYHGDDSYEAEICRLLASANIPIAC